jgi:beta-galactosidase
VNYGLEMRGERAGITKQVTLNGKPLTDWQIYSLPMNNPEKLIFRTADCAGACFYRGALQVDHPGDTFLDTSNFVKGMVWVNGHALGRVWNIGPQKTLYLPGPWLHPGANEVIVFDLDGAPGRTIAGKTKPILNAPVQKP